MAVVAAGGQANRSEPKDFCNSFWGPGDDGVNILFSRMRGAIKTTEELKYFWNERAAIEEQYAARLAGLAKFSLGGEEIGELRQALDTLKAETESQAAAHANLADRIRAIIETQVTALHGNQQTHKKNTQTPVEKLFKQKQSQESFVSKAREKYDGDLLRINSYTQQTQYAQGKDLERLQQKLKRAQQTVQANEKDYNNFTQTLLDMLPAWEQQWKEFCDSCQDLEEERLENMKDNLWAYANEVSTVCVSDDQSCEQIRTVLDQMEPERDIQNFVVDYGTGNTISDPQTVAPYDAQDPTIPSSSTIITRPADFRRVSRRTMTHGALDNYQPPPEPVPPIPQESSSHAGSSGASASTQPPLAPLQITAEPSRGHGRSHSRTREDDARSTRSQPPGPPPLAPPPPVTSEPYHPSTTSTPRRPRDSQPLPQMPNGSHEPPPPIPTHTTTTDTGGVLFYVKALYDYTATIEEEFSFQADDVIAVTATPDDGWWSGELLDEARRVPGRHIFPSNFVCLF